MIIQKVIKKGRLLGYIAGVKNTEGRVMIGVSACRKTDKLNTDFGKSLALERAVKGNNTIPQSFKDDVAAFRDRCANYYRVDNGLVQSSFVIPVKVLKEVCIKD